MLVARPSVYFIITNIELGVRGGLRLSFRRGVSYQVLSTSRWALRPRGHPALQLNSSGSPTGPWRLFADCFAAVSEGLLVYWERAPLVRVYYARFFAEGLRKNTCVVSLKGGAPRDKATSMGGVGVSGRTFPKIRLNG